MSVKCRAIPAREHVGGANFVRVDAAEDGGVFSTVQPKGFVCITDIKGVVRGEDGVVRRCGVHKFHGLHEDEGYLAVLRGKLWQWTVVVLLASGTFALVSTPGR